MVGVFVLFCIEFTTFGGQVKSQHGLVLNYIYELHLMDFLLNTSLNASVSSRQIASHKGEGSSVRPRPDHPEAGQANQAGQINQVNQTNQVSFTSSLSSAANTLDAHKAGSTRASAANKLNIDRSNEQRSKAEIQEAEQRIVDDGATSNAQVQEAELENQARQYIYEVSSARSRESDAAEDRAQSFTEDDARRATDAYQAAGAVFGIGFTEDNDNGPVVFGPENISPIDIQA